METKKKRSTRTSNEQHKIMLDYFTTNKGLAEGRFASLHGRQEAGKKWEELAALLNSVKGAKKTAAQWQVTWRDFKSRTSVKARERRKEMAKTNGNPLTLSALTELEMRVLEVIGHNYSEGSSICPESFPEVEHLQIILETGENDILYQCPTVPNVMPIEVYEAVGEAEENWPIELLNETAEEPAAKQPSKAVLLERQKKKVPKRTQMDFARNQFADIAKQQAEAVMIQANASKLLAEAVLRIASALERLATSWEQLALNTNIN